MFGEGEGHVGKQEEVLPQESAEEGGGESAKRRGSRGKCWASFATEREMWVGSRPLEFALPKPPMTVDEYGQGKAWRHCGPKKGLESCQKMGTAREGAGPPAWPIRAAPMMEG